MRMILTLAVALALMGVAAWRLDAVALALIVGVLVGGLASIPAAVLLVRSMERRMKQREAIDQ